MIIVAVCGPIFGLHSARPRRSLIVYCHGHCTKRRRRTVARVNFFASRVPQQHSQLRFGHCAFTHEGVLGFVRLATVSCREEHRAGPRVSHRGARTTQKPGRLSLAAAVDATRRNRRYRASDGLSGCTTDLEVSRYYMVACQSMRRPHSRR